jgi:hypothetical protein
MGEMRNTYKIFVGKVEGKRPIVRHKNGYEGNIKIDHKELRKRVDWIHLAQDRQVPSSCQRTIEPSGSINDRGV